PGCAAARHPHQLDELPRGAHRAALRPEARRPRDPGRHRDRPQGPGDAGGGELSTVIRSVSRHITMAAPKNRPVSGTTTNTVNPKVSCATANLLFLGGGVAPAAGRMLYSGAAW